jgi:hypothetical protein
MKCKHLPLSVPLVLLVLLLIYIGSYVVLSAGGCYEPATIGLNGVKWYGWAPRGFVVGYKWRRCPMIIYAPLLFLDERCWHTPEKSDSGQYPIDEVRGEDIWKVYQAYGFCEAKEPSEAEADKPK